MESRLLGLAFSTTPRITALLAALLLVEAAQPAALAVATGALIAAVTGAATAPPGPAHSLEAVAPALVAFGAVLLVVELLSPCRIVVRSAVERAVTARVRRTVLGTLAAAPGTAALEDDAVAVKVDRLLQGEFGVFHLGMLSTGQFELVARYVTTIAAAVIVARVSVPLALLLVAGTLVVRAGHRRAELGFVAVQTHAVGYFRRAGYIRELCENAQSAKEVRVFRMGPWLVERYGEEWETGVAPLRRHMLRIPLTHAPAHMLAGVIGSLAYASFGHSVAVGALSVATMATALSAGRSVTAGLQDIGEDLRRRAYGRMGFEALDDVQRLTPRAAQAGTEPAGGMPEREIRFQGVSYAYPSGTAALRDLNAVFEAGRSTAVVGVNGAGKTTLIKLLTGLITAQSGEVLVDGVPLERIDVESWRARLAVIFQDFSRYEMSLADNVHLADPAQRATRAQLERAAERARAGDVVQALPAGWETLLSPHFESGVELSGGQWQKVALARAFCAVERGARVLVLDEPTAALDVKAEAELFDRFLDVTRGLTTILISHRFSTVRHAERIVVMREGGVAEIGSHDELLAGAGIYARMFRAQAERFGVAASS